MIILVHRNVVYNIFVLVCVSNEIQVQHEANRAGGVFLRELPAAHIICFCTGKQKNCRNNIPFTDFYRLLPTCTDFYLKHFVGFQCDAGSAALNTHPKAKRLLGDDSVHEHPGLLVVDSGDPWRDLAAAT